MASSRMVRLAGAVLVLVLTAGCPAWGGGQYWDGDMLVRALVGSEDPVVGQRYAIAFRVTNNTSYMKRVEGIKLGDDLSVEDPFFKVAATEPERMWPRTEIVEYGYSWVEETIWSFSDYIGAGDTKEFTFFVVPQSAGDFGVFADIYVCAPELDDDHPKHKMCCSLSFPLTVLDAAQSVPRLQREGVAPGRAAGGVPLAY